MLYLVKDPLYKSIRINSFIEYGFKMVKLEYKEFPDGEAYIRFQDSIDPEGTYVVLARGFPDQDRNIIRSMLITHTLRDYGAQRIYFCMPYFPYSRQDKRFLAGEAISAKIIAESIVSNIDTLITVDVHNPLAFGYLGAKFIDIRTIDLWSDLIKKNYGNKKCGLVSPDVGRKSFVAEIARKCKVPMASFEKRRDLSTGRIISHEPEDFDSYKGIIGDCEVIIIIDDIIATGSTIANISLKLRSDGFKGKIVVAATHGLLLGNSYDRLVMAGVNEIICSDTVENPFIHRDALVGPYITRTIDRLIQSY